MQNFVSQLQNLLQNELPGQESHFKMIPDQRVKSYYDLIDVEKAKKGAILILIYQNQDSIYFPMIRRAEYDGHHSGQMAFPGGRKDDTDPDFEFTALRETFEEVGVEQNKIQVLGKLTDLYIPPSNFLVKPFVGFIDHKPNFNHNPSEVQYVQEFKLNDLLNPNAISKQKITIFNGLKVETPCYLVDETIIWGGSAMILTEFLDLARNII